MRVSENCPGRNTANRANGKQGSEKTLQDYERAQCTDKSSSRDSNSLTTGEEVGCTTSLLGGGRGSTRGNGRGCRGWGGWGKDSRVVETASNL